MASLTTENATARGIKGWNRYGSIAIISDIGNIGRLEDPIRYHFWMQEYRAQYIAILSGASRAVKSTIKTPFFAYNLEKLLGNQKHPHAKCDTFPLQITRLPKCREWSVLKPWLSFNMSKTLLQNASLGPKRRLLKISIHIANNPICQWSRYWQYAILSVTIIVLGQYGCCPY